MSIKEQFTRIDEREDLGPDEKLAEMISAYKLENRDASDTEARHAVFRAMPALHKLYLDSNGEV